MTGYNGGLHSEWVSEPNIITIMGGCADLCIFFSLGNICEIALANLA